ncbi:hypothetical protein [Paraflavitalea speifideaquila]|uniref:hypothetical protein n=1 Tax=Paraflavitalea speifideaquila TaxID=3076558 RepID=UPI0028E6882E|nr:hypothetical protein [Paraflavitalea speifideiaquila]
MYQLDSAGSIACELQLKPHLETGNYTLRAYTLWMLNFRDYVFLQKYTSWAWTGK